MGLTAVQGGQGPQGGQGLGVQVGGGRQGHQHLVAVEPGVVGAQILGSMADCLIRWTPCPPAPDSAFRALSRAAAEQPISSEVLPMTISPSGSWMAMAGSPVRRAASLAAATTGRMSGVTPACCISSSSL